MTHRALFARLALACTAPFFVTGCTGSDDRPEATPEHVVQAVVDARTAGDCAGVREHVVAGRPAVRCSGPHPVVGPGPRVDRVTIEGDSATVEVVDHYDCGAWDEEPVEYVDRYHLRLDSGEWKIHDVGFAETTSDDCLS